MGHEARGIVEAAADSVTDIQVGDRVVVDPGIFCGYFVLDSQGEFLYSSSPEKQRLITHRLTISA